MTTRSRYYQCAIDFSKVTTMLAVIVGLLSLGPADSFLSAPLSKMGSMSAASGSSRKQQLEGIRSPKYRRSGGGVGMSYVDEGKVVESVTQWVEEETNKDVKPLILTPKRDPRVWFDSIAAGAMPRPKALVDLSKAGEFQLQEVALPHRKQEPYRYTDLESLYRTDFAPAPASGVSPEAAKRAAIEPLLLEASAGQQMVFVNGVYDTELSDVSALSRVEGLVAGPLEAMEGAQFDQAKDVLSFLPETDEDHRTTQGSLPFCSLNQACFTDAAVIMVADGVRIERPVQVIFFSDGMEVPTVNHPRMVVKLGNDAHLSLCHNHVSMGGVSLSNGLTRILVGQRANLEHDYLEELGDADRIVDTISVEQTANSTYSINQVIAGAFDARANLQIDLLETGAHCNVYTAALTTRNQRQDTHTTIKHKAYGTTCQQEQRNVVADKADCVFKGRIVIDQIAQKTDAQQICRTLLVSDKARVTVMPTMEIIANDVKCTHGATIADLEDEELFYLMSRGISRIQAKTLVLKSFADTVVKRFMDKSLRERLTPKILAAAPREERAVKGQFRSI